jgi:hypothetical protein
MRKLHLSPVAKSKLIAYKWYLFRLKGRNKGWTTGQYTGKDWDYFDGYDGYATV